MTTITFKAHFARQIPDPVFPRAERHILMSAAHDVPSGLPKDSNPRKQNIDRRIYRDVGKHLVNREGTPNTFHLKNKGITVLAEQVVKRNDDLYDVVFAPSGQGIVDGAHTYEIVLKHREEILSASSQVGCDAPIHQFVKFEILTGLDAVLATEIAEGLNTAVQVQQMSLADLGQAFGWIKDELHDEPYISDIAFRENEKGAYDVVDILRIMELFNIAEYPNDGPALPIRAYTSKERILDSYLKNKEQYRKLQGILKDILILHDTISSNAVDRYNEGGGRRGGKLVFVDGPAREKKFRFPFIGQQADYQLFRGALFPMLGAFRWMVDEAPHSGRYGWRGSFDRVLSLWMETGRELMEATHATSCELGRKPDAIAKSPNHWKTLYQTVAMREMSSRTP